MLVIMSLADNRISDEEVDFMKDSCKKIGASQEDLFFVIDEVKNNNTNLDELCIETSSKITDEQKQNLLLTELSKLASSDHILHEDELLFLEIISRKWGKFLRSLKEKQ
ncbi:TerB family tellurite resistance protein [Alphaproteobacteria bacterium]|nr:TerB family tellurite resistance protein [Alphaproteobacteria bacterium]